MLSIIAAESPLLTIFPHEIVILSALFKPTVKTSRLFRMARDTECHQILRIVMLRAPNVMRMKIIGVIVQRELADFARPIPLLPIPP